MTIWKYTLKEHYNIKTRILDSIEKTTKEKRIGLFENISNTDYHLKHDFKQKEYFKILDPYLIDFFKVFDKNYYCTEHDTNVGWFQQYYKNDRHDWHFHGYSNISCVYFVELSNYKESTQFFYKNKLYQMKVKEGDILVFPSFIPHRSPIIKTENHRKTIISFNVNIIHPDEKTLTK